MKKTIDDNFNEQEEFARLVKIVSSLSSWYGDKILDFLDEYNLLGLKDAKYEQLAEYVEKNNLEEVYENYLLHKEEIDNKPCNRPLYDERSKD